MTRPLLLLDIDGVLAPMEKDRQPGMTYDVAETDGWNGAVLFIPDVIVRVQRLIDSGLVDAQWISSWARQWMGANASL